MSVRIKRVYDKPAKADGMRILVDRVWPRGMKKEEAHVDRWMKELAPSTELRKWFGHDPAKWDGFRDRYFRELGKVDGPVDELAGLAGKRRITLVFGAKDTDHNNAVALKEYLEEKAG